jgi:hypothetical protein
MEVGGWVVPEDAPGIEVRVVDAQRRAVPVSRDRQRCDIRAAVGKRRDHPHILDRSPLEYPPGVDFAASGMGGAALLMGNDVHFPAANEPSVKLHLLGSIRRRAGAQENIGETRIIVTTCLFKRRTITGRCVYKCYSSDVNVVYTPI